jgi:hypothetical protein
MARPAKKWVKSPEPEEPKVEAIQQIGNLDQPAKVVPTAKLETVLKSDFEKAVKARDDEIASLKALISFKEEESRGLHRKVSELMGKVEKVKEMTGIKIDVSRPEAPKNLVRVKRMKGNFSYLDQNGANHLYQEGDEFDIPEHLLAYERPGNFLVLKRL